jgi:ABC-type tungstate transport system substrate-binding protein
MKKLSKQDIRNTLAVAWTALSFIFLFKLLTREIPESNKDVVMTIAGVVVGQLVGVIGYYFGQSKSEVDKAKPNEEEI